MNGQVSPLSRILIVLVISALGMVSLSCIFDSEPSIPGYPAEIDASISFGSIGSPTVCKCMGNHDVALIAAGSNLVLIDIVNGQNEAVIDLGLEIDDIADSDAGGYGYVLTDSLLYPVNLSNSTAEKPIDLGIGCSYISVSGEGDAWLAMDNDSIAVIDLSTYKLEVVHDISLNNCQGIASADNGSLFIADGNSGCIIGYDVNTWSETGRISVPGEVYDLFPGPQGYICAIVDGSNELWYIKSETSSLYKMITFPVIPAAAASMPDGSYAYAACAGTGMVIVAQSGQMELRTMEYGLPSSIDISSDGERAIVCSPDNEAVYILVK